MKLSQHGAAAPRSGWFPLLASATPPTGTAFGAYDGVREAMVQVWLTRKLKITIELADFLLFLSE